MKKTFSVLAKFIQCCFFESIDQLSLISAFHVSSFTLDVKSNWKKTVIMIQ